MAHTKQIIPLPARRPAMRLAIIAGILGSLYASGALAAQPASDAAVALPDVVVTAAGYEQKIKEAPASISVLTRQDLESQPFTDLKDAVRHLEGVSIVGESGEQDISIRGMSGEYTLIMVDGKRQNTRETMNRGTGGVQPSMIPPLEAIERIEVVRGPMSSLYGSDAMGGVINIITRKVPAQWHGSVNLGGIFQEHSRYGDTGQGDFWLGGPVSDGLVGFQVYGNYSDRAEDHVFYPGNSTGGAKGTRDGSLTAKLTVTPSADQDLTFEAGHNALTYERTAGRTLADNAADLKTRHTRDNWAITHNGRWGWANSTLALYQEIGKQETWTGGSKSASEPKTTNTTLDALLTLPFSRNMLKLGAQYGSQKVEDIAGEASIKGYPVNADSVSINTWALFAEDAFHATDALTLTAGARLDHDERYGSHVTPRLYAVYALTPAVTLRGGVAKGFKAPTLRQSTAGYCMTSGGGSQKQGTLCGNPDLDPEESTTEEIGIRYDAEGSSASFTVFNNDFRNKVVSYDTGVPDPRASGRSIYVYDNIAKVNIRGVELSASQQLNKQWKLSGNYTYTDSKREGGGEPAYNGSSLDGRPLDKTPRDMANLQLDWTPTDKVSAYARASYYGKQYWAAFRNGATGVRERPASTTFDLGGSYVINKTFTVTAAVLNLTDKIVDIDPRGRNQGLDGNWMVDEGRRYWVKLNAHF